MDKHTETAVKEQSVSDVNSCSWWWGNTVGMKKRNWMKKATETASLSDDLSNIDEDDDAWTMLITADREKAKYIVILCSNVMNDAEEDESSCVYKMMQPTLARLHKRMSLIWVMMINFECWESLIMVFLTFLVTWFFSVCGGVFFDCNRNICLLNQLQYHH